MLAEDEAERREGDPRQQLQTAEERAQWPNLVKVPPRGTAVDRAYAQGLDLAEQHAEYAAALGRLDPAIVDEDLRTYLRDHGVAFDPESEAYYDAALAVLRANVKALELRLERHRGKDVPTPPRANVARGPKLSEAFASWKAGSGTRGSRKPSGNTVLEAEYAVRRLAEWVGDIRLGDLTREKATEFVKALAAVPTRLPSELKRLPLRDLLRRDLTSYPPQHAATVNKHITLLSAIVTHAEAAGKLDAMPNFRNPFGKGVKLVLDARAAEQRQRFTDADLKAIFETAVYQNGERPKGGGGEAAYWLPLLALLSGARQGELAQLRVADLAQDPESRVWFLNISMAGGRTIKTASSRRQVPVHPELERIGLLRYRQMLVDAGAGPDAPLWPHVEADSVGRQSGPWSKWFNRYLRDKARIEDRAKVFHSFRHSFKWLARNAKIGEEMHDALTGHSGGGIGRGYGAGFGLKALAEELARIEAPGAVRGLRWEPAGAK
jgi:integrase